VGPAGQAGPRGGGGVPTKRAGLGAVVVRRVAVGVVSGLVLAGTGYAWSALHSLTTGLTTSNALSGLVDPSGAVVPRLGADVNILLMGLDTRLDQNGDPLPAAVLEQLHAGDGSDGGYNTNTLILMHVPAGGGMVTAFSIPRDDYVAVRDIPGNDHVKIKEAYGLKKAAVEDAAVKAGTTDRHQLEALGREAGRRETLQTVQDFLGVHVDHFAEVSLAGFYDLATALNGVQVCLNHAVNDPYSGADFPAGVQTLNGAQSLAFVRQRHGLDNGDLDRTHRQQAFLASVTQKLSSAGTFTNVGQLRALIDVAARDVVVDSGWDIGAFIPRASNLTGGNIQFTTLPILRFDTIDGQSVNVVDQRALAEQVQVAFGLRPAPTPPAPLPTGPLTIDVVNAGAAPGVAGSVATALAGGRWSRGTVGNTSAQATAVSYGTGAQAQADAIARLVQAPGSSADDTLAPDTVRVVLGAGFTASPTLQSDAAALRTPPPPAATTTGGATPTTTGPQGNPVDGGGIPCVN
jgi:LCP family protein required for cell wall assembly